MSDKIWPATEFACASASWFLFPIIFMKVPWNTVKHPINPMPHIVTKPSVALILNKNMLPPTICRNCRSRTLKWEEIVEESFAESTDKRLVNSPVSLASKKPISCDNRFLKRSILTRVASLIPLSPKQAARIKVKIDAMVPRITTIRTEETKETMSLVAMMAFRALEE